MQTPEISGWCIICLVALLTCWNANSRADVQEDTLRFGNFDDVHIYRASSHPKHVMLFISGDGGWNLSVIDMARELTGLDVLVAGIDITTYFKRLATARQACSYPAADFEGLSQYLQKYYDFPAYVEPLLGGYSSGATLVYATLVQAPPNTFSGGIGMGFCPDLPLSKPLCHGSGLQLKSGPGDKGYEFLPAANSPTTWFDLQGDLDQVCNVNTAERFVAQTGHAELVKLADVGYGFSVQRNWMPQFKASFNR